LQILRHGKEDGLATPHWQIQSSSLKFMKYLPIQISENGAIPQPHGLRMLAEERTLLFEVSASAEYCSTNAVPSAMWDRYL
jgi:hypothetical protein